MLTIKAIEIFEAIELIKLFEAILFEFEPMLMLQLIHFQ